MPVTVGPAKTARRWHARGALLVKAPVINSLARGRKVSDGSDLNNSSLSDTADLSSFANDRVEFSNVTIAEGGSAEIDGADTQFVTFTGLTGTLTIDHALAFTGQVFGLAGADALDLADRNRYELPRPQWSARASVTDRHPVLAHGLDDVWDVGMRVAQKFLGLAACPWRSKHWTPLIVDAMQQDGQEQAVVDVADVEQRSPGR